MFTVSSVVKNLTKNYVQELFQTNNELSLQPHICLLLPVGLKSASNDKVIRLVISTELC